MKESLKNTPNYKGLVTWYGPFVIVKIAEVSAVRDVALSPHYTKLMSPQPDLLNPQSMTRLEGDKHKRMRKLLSKSFHFDFIQDSVPVIAKVANKKFEEWESTGMLNDYLNLTSEAGNFTGEVVGVIFFGESHAGEIVNGKRFTEVVADLLVREARVLVNGFKYPWYPFLFKLQIFKEHRDVANDIKNYRDHCQSFITKKREQIQEAIKQGRQEELKDSKDLVYHLLMTQINAPNEEDKLSDEEILSQYLLFMNAGEDTSGHVLTMCLYNLALNPKYIEELREEIKTNIQDLNQIKYDEINSCNLLNAVIKETMRIYGPTPMLFARIATKDNKVGDLKILKGSLVNVFTTANTWRPQYNFVDPDNFIPERWIGNGEGNALKDSYAYVPFWAGSRNCIGQHLATLELKMFLIKVLTRYSFQLKEDYQLKMTVRFLYEPVDPVMMKFTKLETDKQTETM
jgi:cytochrome P450